ncbi:M48 family metalloprotease [Lampropedia aestuarii]|uniref:M48 family metalloprotease n=1 Tax=Lampropedia aestuarii TaxID=2562762 RepID=UPI002468EB2E|nr:M48 family metalloprotease [Lampropedia aestuarii]MDH5857107.1 M48 family metalloprotease [Lampropedia aestuarii]
MAIYENPVARDDVNVTAHSSLGEFVQLSLALAAGLVVLVVALTYGFRWVAPWIPFGFEQRIAAPVAARLAPASEAPAKQRYLQNLAEQLGQHMDLPAGMQLQLHWSNSREPNAFATLGGHIAIHQGLLDSVQSENGLAMVLAHEIAHVRHRDPLVSAGSGLILASSMALLLGSGSESIVGRTTAALTQLQFSRQQEQAADAAALNALLAHYGHLQGADEFFAAMQAQSQSLLQQAQPEFLQTHPDSAKRLALIRNAAKQAALDLQAEQLQRTALPAFVTAASAATRQK